MWLWEKVVDILAYRSHPDTELLQHRETNFEVLDLIRFNNLSELKGALVRGSIQANESYQKNTCHPILNFAVVANKRDVVRLLLLYKGTIKALPDKPTQIYQISLE